MPAGRRSVVVAAVAAIVLTPFAVPANAAEPAEASAGTGPLDEAQAAAAARASGRRVEVTANRTETETLYANPDGSWTLDLTTEPTRVQKDGAWLDIDPTLVRRADGSIAPVATSLGMTLSGGGSGPLATLDKDGNSLALSWPKPLPEPSLDGPAATYAEVLPGVDLVLTASARGFSEVLVVKNRAAALNPALRRVAFGAKAAGLTLKADAAGGFTALDAAGLPALVAPEATMWDSRAGHAPDRVKGAREGDRVARMKTEVSQSSIAVVPDAAMLADPSTAFPLYLDPTTSTMSHTARAMVDENYPSNEYYQFTGDEGVGYQNFSGVSKKRQFHAFSTSAIAGSYVQAATFKAFETHAASCTATEVELWRTGGISSGTNWSNQPAWYQYLDNAVVAYGRDGCPTYPAGAWVEFDARAGAQVAADTDSASLTLGLKAGSETNNLYWKRFRYDATLSITYNRAPTASGLRIATPAKTCATGTSRPWINDPTPTLAGTVNDADASDVAKAEFEYGQIGGTRYTALTGYLAAPSEHTHTVAAGRMNGNPVKAYSWRVRGYDSIVFGSYTGLCEFYLDQIVPGTTVVSAAGFPENGLSDYGVGQAGGSFTFAPAAGDGDVDYYKYSFNSDSLASTSNAATLNASVTINYTPTQAGLNYLKVKSYDRAGNPSTNTYTYIFKVGTLNRTADFKVDEGTGTSTCDSITTTRCASFSASGASWGEGRWYQPIYAENDKALVLDGATGSIASTTSGVVDTSKPFTVGVSAWLDRTSGDLGTYKLLSQNSVSTSAFQIGYEPINGVPGWFFRMARTDVAAPSWSRVDIPGAGLQTQQWVHLTAVYDGSTIALTVNGDSATRIATGHSGAFASSGSFIMGAGRSSNYWPGRVDRVTVFPGVLDPTEISTLSNET